MAVSIVPIIKGAVLGIYGLDGKEVVYLDHPGHLLLWTDRGGMWTEGNAQRTLSTIQSSTAITVARVNANRLSITSKVSYSTALVAVSDRDITFSTT